LRLRERRVQEISRKKRTLSICERDDYSAPHQIGLLYLATGSRFHARLMSESRKRLPKYDLAPIVLLFGTDRTLLDIRALVLRSAGIAVYVTTDMNEVQKRIGDGESVYRAVVSCYTATDGEREEIAAITVSSGKALWQLDGFVSPADLIAAVSELLTGQ
jgi:hypothetical protein